MTNFKKIATSLALMSSLVAGQKTSQAGTHPDTTNVVDKVQEMLQRDTTPTTWAESASEYQNLPPIASMPRTDKISCARIRQEYYDEFFKVQSKHKKAVKQSGFIMDWGTHTYKRYSDDMLEFNFTAHTKDDPKPKQYKLFYGKDKKIFNLSRHPNNQVHILKQWSLDRHGYFECIDYAKNIKVKGNLMYGVYKEGPHVLEYTLSEGTDKHPTNYTYRAELLEKKSPYGPETKLKTYETVTVDQKTLPQMVVDRVYRGSVVDIYKEFSWSNYSVLKFLDKAKQK